LISHGIFSRHERRNTAVELNETLKTIFSRKSVRAYAEGTIPREKLEMLARAGMAAPSAVDQRPWEFIIVTEPSTLKALAARLPYAKMTAHAGAAIVVCGDLRRQWGGPVSTMWVIDCAAATENILLAAESMGLGAVWTALYPYAERIQPVKELLGLPEYIQPLALVPVGIPRGGEKPKDKWNAQRIHWEQW
jgi:nitroreductase